MEVFFFKKIDENFVGTLETVRNRDVSVPRGSIDCRQLKHTFRFISAALNHSQAFN